MADNYDFDLFVIGAGSGGVRAARADAFVFATRLSWLSRALATSNHTVPSWT